MGTNKRISCDCQQCKNACTNKPGWFKPGEAEKVADFLGISLKQLFDSYLAVDFIRNNDQVIFLLSPNVTTNKPGQVWPFYPAGQCVFFKNGKCTIHPVAPYECQAYHHTEKFVEIQKRHLNMPTYWQDHQDQITQLLGHPPMHEEPTMNDMLDIIAKLMESGLNPDKL